MSNETDDNKMNINSSFDSKDIRNNNPRENDINSTSSRLSSASKKNQQHQQQSAYVNNSFPNESSIETRIKSPTSSRQNTDQLSNHKLTNEEQSTFNNHSHSSFHVNETNNDGPTVNNQNLTNNSIDDQQGHSHRPIIHFSNYLAPSFSIMNTSDCF
jgi:hypothetical protein